MAELIDPPVSEAQTRASERLLIELGQGGMGTVFLAVARGAAGFTKLKVVKRLRQDLSSDAYFAKMFLDEARLSARLNHPNIIQIYDMGFDGAHHFIEMEYLEGQSFAMVRRRLAKTGTLSLPLTLWVLAETLAALHYSHELTEPNGTPLDVVHRDVSPQNVFITYDGAIKLLDFGIAKSTDSSLQTRTGDLKGKLTYMAPEQAARQKVDRRTDVFAVGVMMWEALTNKRFWQGRSDLQIIMALEKGDFRSPKAVRPDIPDELEGICMKALAAKRDDRYATALDFQNALEDYIARTGERVGPRPLASIVTTTFAEDRARMKAEIESQLSKVNNATESSPLEISTLSAAQGSTPVRTGDSLESSPAPLSVADETLTLVDSKVNRGEPPPGDESLTLPKQRSPEAGEAPPARANSRLVMAVSTLGLVVLSIALVMALLHR